MGWSFHAWACTHTHIQRIHVCMYGCIWWECAYKQFICVWHIKKKAYTHTCTQANYVYLYEYMYNMQIHMYTYTPEVSRHAIQAICIFMPVFTYTYKHKHTYQYAYTHTNRELVPIDVKLFQEIPVRPSCIACVCFFLCVCVCVCVCVHEERTSNSIRMARVCVCVCVSACMNRTLEVKAAWTVYILYVCVCVRNDRTPPAKARRNNAETGMWRWEYHSNIPRHVKMRAPLKHTKACEDESTTKTYQGMWRWEHH